MTQTPRWFVSLIGALFLAGGGFLLGLVLGVVSEEPDLVVEHLAGRGEEVPWTPDSEPGLSEPARRAEPDAGEAPAPASPPPLGGRSRDVPVVAAAPPQPAPQSVHPPRPAPAARRPAAARPAPGFAVQVGAFSGSDVAQGLAARLRGKGFDAYVTPSAGPQDGRWRVRVGPVASKEAAERVAEKLESQEQLPTWVLSEAGR